MKNFYRTKWGLAFSGIICFIVFLVASVITYIIRGRFNFNAVFGSFTGLSIIVIINGIYVYFKRDKTPEVDERIRNNIIKYFAYSSHIVFLLFMATLTVISFMGIESISISYLWIGIIVYMFVIGIGAMIVKHR